MIKHKEIDLNINEISRQQKKVELTESGLILSFIGGFLFLMLGIIMRAMEDSIFSMLFIIIGGIVIFFTVYDNSMNKKLKEELNEILIDEEENNVMKEVEFKTAEDSIDKLVISKEIQFRKKVSDAKFLKDHKLILDHKNRRLYYFIVNKDYGNESVKYSMVPYSEIIQASIYVGLTNICASSLSSKSGDMNEYAALGESVRNMDIHTNNMRKINEIDNIHIYDTVHLEVVVNDEYNSSYEVRLNNSPIKNKSQVRRIVSSVEEWITTIDTIVKEENIERKRKDEREQKEIKEKEEREKKEEEEKKEKEEREQKEKKERDQKEKEQNQKELKKLKEVRINKVKLKLNNDEEKLIDKFLEKYIIDSLIIPNVIEFIFQIIREDSREKRFLSPAPQGQYASFKNEVYRTYYDDITTFILLLKKRNYLADGEEYEFLEILKEKQYKKFYERYKGKYYILFQEKAQKLNLQEVVHLFIQITGERNIENAYNLSFFNRYLVDHNFQAEEIDITDLYKKIENENKYYLALKMEKNLLNSEKISELLIKESFIDIERMSGIEFEYFIVKVLEALGFIANITKATGDQGVDILAERNSKIYAVQTKRYSSAVGNKAIQEVVSGKQFYDVDEGWVITNSTFTKSANALAESTNTLLWDGEKLKQMIKTVNTLEKL